MGIKTDMLAEKEKGKQPSRSQITLNLITVLLLSLLCFAVILMPKYNYAHYSKRIANVEAKTYALEIVLSKVNLLAGVNENQRATILGKIDFICEHLKSLESNEVAFLENQAALTALGSGELRKRQPMDGSDGAPSMESKGPIEGSSKSSPCGGIDDCIARYFPHDGPTARTMAQMTHEEFISKLSQQGGTPRLRVEMPIALLESLFKVYKYTVETINRNETLYTEAQVHEAVRAGNYVDISDPKVEEPDGVKKALDQEYKGTLTYVSFLEDGRRVQFSFPYFDDPNYNHFEQQRDRALRSFLILLDGVMTADPQNP